MTRRTCVFGPAYLDRVLLVDRPLSGDGSGPPLDRSVEGRLETGDGLDLIDPSGSQIRVVPPADWPGPTGRLLLSRPLFEGTTPRLRSARGLSWHDDLGGMGAGYAKAFGGRLVSALGSEDDSTSRAVGASLEREGIDHHPVRVEGQSADWTLLVTSGPFGDKMPIGFRGCHAAVATFIAGGGDLDCDLLAVAGLANRQIGPLLEAEGPAVRFLAPAMRNMVDREVPLGSLAGPIDVLSCNRGEWEALADRDALADQVAILAITEGPRGSRVRFRSASGGREEVHIPAFPRDEPPRDTNRAGEAYAATLVATLLDEGWRPGPVSESLVRQAALRASAAAALVIGRSRFGLPDKAEIDRAIRAGRVAADSGGEPGDVR
jgi:ribokinase